MRLIIVPLDGSPFAERALPPALDLAARHGARVEIVGVHQVVPVVNDGQGGVVFEQHYDAELRAGTQRYLDDALARIRANTPAHDVSAVLLQGAPAAAISAYARAQHADLVVLASHGRSGPARWMLGSVTDGLLRRLTIPILVVRGAEQSAAPVAVPFRHVVIALDRTPESERAVSTAVHWLGDAHTTFTLLHIVPPLHPVMRTLATPDELVRYTTHQEASARLYLKDAAAREATHASVQTAVHADVHPAHGITQFAVEHGADLVVLSTHGRSPIERAFLGSVADKVLRTATVPLLLCHTPRFEETEPAETSG